MTDNTINKLISLLKTSNELYTNSGFIAFNFSMSGKIGVHLDKAEFLRTFDTYSVTEKGPNSEYKYEYYKYIDKVKFYCISYE